jgi:hypothetical protein
LGGGGWGVKYFLKHICCGWVDKLKSGTVCAHIQSIKSVV